MQHKVVTRRRATNVTLTEESVAEAKALGISISKACQAGLTAALREERNRRWAEDHSERIDAFTTWFEENGLPFADLRVY